MEEQIKLIFNKISSPTGNTNSLQEAQSLLDSFWQNTDFYQSLFSLFRNINEPHVVRLMAIIELKRQIKLHWNNFSDESQQIFLNNIQNLILGITTHEPQYHSFVSDFTNVLLSLSFAKYFTSYWANLIISFIMSDEDHFYSGLLILINVLQIVQKYGNEEFKAQFNNNFLLHLFERITAVYSELNSNLFLKTQCLIAAILTVELIPNICVEPTFSPWYESLKFLVNEESEFLHPFDEITAIFMSKLVELYEICQKNFVFLVNPEHKIFQFQEVPFSSQLLILCFSIMYQPSWQNNCNQSLIVNIFNFFSLLANKVPSTWNENFFAKMPDIVQNVFIPVFLLPPDSLQLALVNPFEFINEYHVDNLDVSNNINQNISRAKEDNFSSEEEEETEEVDSNIFSQAFKSDFYFENYDSITPIEAGSKCLRLICEKHPKIHEFLYNIATSTLTNFMTSEAKDFLTLYSVFHMVHSYWEIIVSLHYDNARVFMDQLIPLIQVSLNLPSSISSNKSCVYLFQSSLLLIISRANPYINNEANVDINPSYIEVSIHLLDSESPLVKYFASFSLYYLLQRFNTDKYDENIMNVCLPHALKVITNIIEYARMSGKTTVASIISTFLKDKEIVKSVIEHTPYLIESVFSIATSLVEQSDKNNFVNLPPLFDTLANLIDQLDMCPREQEILCTMIFQKCYDSFSVFCFYKTFYELIEIILGVSPNYIPELYNQIFQPIVSILPNSFFKGNYIIMDISLIFHNMMLRNPEFMISMNHTSIENIINNTNVNQDPNANPNSLFEIGNLIVNNYNDITTINFYYSSLLAIIPPNELPPNVIPNLIDLIDIEDALGVYINDNYDTCVDLFLMLLSIDAKSLVQKDDGRLFSIYLELFSPTDMGCALSFGNQFIPLEVRNNYIHDIIKFPLQTLLEDGYDYTDIIRFEIENICVDQNRSYVPVFTKQRKFSILQNYLRDLASNDPDFLNHFSEYNQNLIDILNFQIQ